MNEMVLKGLYVNEVPEVGPDEQRTGMLRRDHAKLAVSVVPKIFVGWIFLDPHQRPKLTFSPAIVQFPRSQLSRASIPCFLVFTHPPR